MILAHGNGASPAMDDDIVADGIERFRATGCTRSFLSTRWLAPKTGLRSPSRLTSCLAVSHPRAVLAPGYRMIRVRDGDFGCRWNCEAFCEHSRNLGHAGPASTAGAAQPATCV
jgi:hypothetical protein